MSTTGSGFQSKLVKLLLIQLVVISASTLLGVLAASKIFEDILIKEALKSEAEHYWTLFESDSNYPLPDTDNLVGFLARGADFSGVPEGLREVSPGYGRVFLDQNEPIVYVSERAGNRLFLVFDELQVTQLALYFGIVPLSGVLLLLYLLAWFSYRHARRVVSPVVKLAEVLENFDWRREKQLNLNLNEIRFASDSEAMILIDALRHFTERLSFFIERERNFTRDASHELRTPLAVIQGSLDIIDRSSIDVTKKTAALARIRRTANEMGSLIEALLLLAREEGYDGAQSGNAELSPCLVQVNQLVHAISEQEQLSVKRPQLVFSVEENSVLVVNAQEKMLSIVLSNLIQNALRFTQKGEVKVVINSQSIEVRDTGVGMSKEDLSSVFDVFYRVDGSAEGGQGLGLAIVKRICERCSWSISVRSTEGVGSKFLVEFPLGS